MRIKVDAAKCQGHNRCCTLAPELFDADDLGLAFTLNDGHVKTEFEEKAKLAFDNCPEYAIDIEK